MTLAVIAFDPRNINHKATPKGTGLRILPDLLEFFHRLSVEAATNLYAYLLTSVVYA
jgi:hypothetical protein